MIVVTNLSKQALNNLRMIKLVGGLSDKDSNSKVINTLLESIECTESEPETKKIGF